MYEAPLVTSLAKTLLRAVLAVLMLFAVSVPAIAEIGCIDVPSVSAVAQSPHLLSSEAMSSDSEDGRGDPSDGSGLCHMGHCAHSLTMSLPAAEASPVVSMRPPYWTFVRQQAVVDRDRGIKRPPRS